MPMIPPNSPPIPIMCALIFQKKLMHMAISMATAVPNTKESTHTGISILERYNTQAITEAINQLDSNRKSNEDGIWGDDYYRAEEELRKTQDELRDEIVASLRSKSRKGNTKEDIAKRLEAIISNMDYIL